MSASQTQHIEVVSNAKTGFRRSLAQAGVVVMATAAGAANAAIDVASITSTISEGVVAAAAIGLAFLGFKAGIAVFKSLRSAA